MYDIRRSLPSILAVVLVLCCTTVLTAADDRPFVVRQRQLQIVAEQADQFTLDGVRWGFDDNDLDRPRFKRTTVDVNRIRQVYYWSQRFNPEWLAAHGMLVFLMNDADGVTADDGSRDIGLVMTVEVHYRVGDSYSPLKGLGKNYGIIYQTTTVGDRVQWAMSMWKQALRPYRLDLSADQRRALLCSTLRDGTLDRSAEFYNTVTNSCVSNAFRLINTVVERHRTLHLWRIPGILFNMQVGLPNLAPGYLCRRGVGIAEPIIDVGSPTVSFPTAAGAPFVFDVAARPGQQLAAELAPLVQGLQQLHRWGEAMACLEELNGLLSPTDPRFFDYLKEGQRLGTAIAELQPGLLELLADEAALRCYLALPATHSNGTVEAFDEELLRRIRFSAQNGHLSPDLAALAEKVLGH